MRGESLTIAPTLGAGRRFSYSYPSLGQTSNLNVPTADAAAGRPFGVPFSSFFNATETGLPPTPRGMVIYAGRVAWAMTSNVASGIQCTPNFGGINRPMCLPFQTTRTPNVSFEGLDDYWCWSISAVFAFDAMPGPITGDIGLVIGAGTRAQIRGAAAFEGFEIGPTGVGTVGVVVRQVDAGPITLAQDIGGVVDMTAFHRYEIRLIGPTRTAEAQVKFLIDGVSRLSVPYGAGTVLPSQAGSPAGAGNIGFTPGIVNFAANAGTTRMYFAPSSLVVSAAPTEAALL